MQYQPPLNRWATFLLLAAVLFSPVFLQGCDTVSSPEEDPNEITSIYATETGKLRHAGFLDAATRTRTNSASKSGTSMTGLFLGFNEYEADGVTPRVLNRYEVTNRIINEYGITRRVLARYDLTNRLLKRYDITRRIINRYELTNRLLKRYGITPQLLAEYGDQVTPELLARFNITEQDLLNEEMSMADIDDFNRLSQFLNDHGISVEQFFQEVENTAPAIRVKVVFDSATLGISIDIASDILAAFMEEIVDDPDVSFAEPDPTLNLSNLATFNSTRGSRQVMPWGLWRTQTPRIHERGMANATYNVELPVHVFILDSGAQQPGEIEELNYVEKKDFTMLFTNPEQLYWDESDAPDVSGFDPGDDGNPYDGSGHGSHIAGTIGAYDNAIGIAGTAPGVQLHSLKVLTNAGNTDITTLLAAINYVTSFKLANPTTPVVANLSLGVDLGTTTYNILDETVEKSIQAGVIYVVAAGNDGRDASTYSPAHVTDAITVGAYNEDLEFSTFSNYGPVVDILAPGENIISLSHLGSETDAMENILSSGTSYAAPHVVGAIVHYLGENPKATPEEVKNAITNAAVSNLVSGIPSETTPLVVNARGLVSRR